MANLQAIKDDIISLSTAQKGKWNNETDVKLHTIVVGSLSRPEEDFVTDTIADVEGLTSTDFTTLQGMLSADSQLSSRPC